jgi:hypothetical protein
MPAKVILGPGREFLVRGHQRGCDVVSQKECVGSHVEELDDIVVADNTATTSLGK